MTRSKKSGVVAQPAIVDASDLLADLRSLIQSARQRVASVANATTTLLCWSVGRRLLRENLQGGRAAYGKQIVATVSQQLTSEFGAGFSYDALTRMARFAEWMTDENILATLSQELSWSHFIELLPVKDPLARDFYAEMCCIERWDVRTLRKKIGGMLFERTALSKKPKAIVATEIAKPIKRAVTLRRQFGDFPRRPDRIGYLANKNYRCQAARPHAPQPVQHGPVARRMPGRSESVTTGDTIALAQQSAHRRRPTPAMLHLPKLSTALREIHPEAGKTHIARRFSDDAIVVTLSQQLGWSHIHALPPIKVPLTGKSHSECGV